MLKKKMYTYMYYMCFVGHAIILEEKTQSCTQWWVTVVGGELYIHDFIRGTVYSRDKDRRVV